MITAPAFTSAAGGPFTITSLSDGFVITENEDTIPVAIATNKGFWENLILKGGGKITAYASSDGAAVSQPIEWLSPQLPRNPAASITAYGGGVVLDASPLRWQTAQPLVILVQAKNQRGEVVAEEEVRGIIVPQF